MELVLTLASGGLDLIAHILGFVLGTVNDIVVMAATNDFITKIKTFIAPFLIGIVTIMSVTFLWKRQIMQLVVFLIFAIIVFAIFWGGDFLQTIGQDVGDSAKTIKW